jgi:hypothetical protein
MNTTDQGFIAHWRIIGPILQQFERVQMRCYTETNRQRDIRALLDVPIIFRPTNTSGLVEQQRRFRLGQK